MSFIRKICGIAALLASMSVVADAYAGTVDDIRSRGVLRIVGIINEEPYFTKDPRTGEWHGFAIDMAQDIAKELNVKLEVVESSWGNAVLDVQSNKVDLSFGATATPARALSVAISSPTYFNSFAIVTKKDELKGKSWAELNDPKYSFAVDMNSAQDMITQQYLPKANVLRFKTRDEAIIAVSTGKADALVNTMLNALVVSKKAVAVGNVVVPTPNLATPSAILINPNADETFKRFVSTWADYHRRIGDNQIWILKSLSPFGITEKDIPSGFSFNQ